MASRSATLAPLIPVFLSYVLSFVYVGIYWNNHHHMLHASKKVSGSILWANLHLLFWLSLLPFATGWMGENHFAALPSALYGVILLGAAIAYWVLQQTIIAVEGPGSVLAVAVGHDWKGKLSPLLYISAIVSTAWNPWIAQAIYAIVRTDLGCARPADRACALPRRNLSRGRVHILRRSRPAISTPIPFS